MFSTNFFGKRAFRGRGISPCRAQSSPRGPPWTSWRISPPARGGEGVAVARDERVVPRWRLGVLVPRPEAQPGGPGASCRGRAQRGEGAHMLEEGKRAARLRQEEAARRASEAHAERVREKRVEKVEEVEQEGLRRRGAGRRLGTGSDDGGGRDRADGNPASRRTRTAKTIRSADCASVTLWARTARGGTSPRNVR